MTKKTLFSAAWLGLRLFFIKAVFSGVYAAFGYLLIIWSAAVEVVGVWRALAGTYFLWIGMGVVCLYLVGYIWRWAWDSFCFVFGDGERVCFRCGRRVAYQRIGDRSVLEFFGVSLMRARDAWQLKIGRKSWQSKGGVNE